MLCEAFTTTVAGIGLLRELGVKGFVGASYIAVATEATHQDEALGLLRETAECVEQSARMLGVDLCELLQAGGLRDARIVDDVVPLGTAFL